jgi:hypothetical protein
MLRFNHSVSIFGGIPEWIRRKLAGPAAVPKPYSIWRRLYLNEKRNDTRQEEKSQGAEGAIPCDN